MNENRKVSGTTGLEIIGMIVAGILSWTANHSIGWLILHVILGWFYVVYYLICK